MSNIPQAREIIEMVLKICPLDAVTRRHLHRALALMTRASPVRRATATRCKLNSNVRRQIRNLSMTDMTMFEIATSTGVNNQGVSLKCFAENVKKGEPIYENINCDFFALVKSLWTRHIENPLTWETSMNKLLSVATLVLLSSTSVLAQTATGVGVGTGVANSRSQSGAVAISGQGGQGGNVTINSNVPPVQTVNTNVSGTTTSNINQKLSGSTRTETVASGTQTVKNVPGVIAPGLTAAGLETCLGSASGGVSAVGFGVSGGSTYKDEDCTARLDSRTLFAMGLKAAAVARLCQRADIWRSMPDICQRYWPVGQPLPAGLVVVTPEVTPGLIAPRRQINDPYGYERPYAMGGTSMEVIDGKTGLTRPCSDYNSVRQKCLNWADAPQKTKLASSKPKKLPVSATAAGNPVTASVVTEPKKED